MITFKKYDRAVNMQIPRSYFSKLKDKNETEAHYSLN